MLDRTEITDGSWPLLKLILPRELLLLPPVIFACFICFQKIERLKGQLHLLDADSKQKNSHTFFVDSKKEGTYKYKRK